MNTHAKGARIENLARKWYEARGWKVYRPPWNRWGEKDIFGWGDLLVCRPWEAPKLVQVRVRSGASASALAKGGKVQALARIANKGFRIALMLYAGKRAKRVPEWEERTLIQTEWLVTYSSLTDK